MITSRENTLTAHEACEILRANLIPMSEDTLIQLLLESKLPFGCATKKSDKTTVLIFKKPFRLWVNDMIEDPNFITF